MIKKPPSPLITQARAVNVPRPYVPTGIKPGALQLKEAKTPVTASYRSSTSMLKSVIQASSDRTSKSGRSAAKISNLMGGYSSDQVEEVERAASKAGYVGKEISKVVNNTIAENKIDLAAHGTGGSDSGTQGNFASTQGDAKKLLISTIKANPKEQKKRVKSAHVHNAEQREEHSQKKEASKVAKEVVSHNKFHQNPLNRGKTCGVCGKFIS